MKVFHVDQDPPYYALVQWRPTIEIPPRKNSIGVGKPLLRLEAYSEHVELCHAWCFSSGHMEFYEQEVMRRVERRGFSDAFFGELGTLFSPAGAAEVQALYESGPYAVSDLSG